MTTTFAPTPDAPALPRTPAELFRLCELSAARFLRAAASAHVRKCRLVAEPSGPIRDDLRARHRMAVRARDASYAAYEAAAQALADGGLRDAAIRSLRDMPAREQAACEAAGEAYRGGAGA